MTSRAIVFIASRERPSETAPELAVPCVPAAEGQLLVALRTRFPDCREVAIDLGPEGPAAEQAMLDYWTDLTPPERRRVWAVTGALAGGLLRFDDCGVRGTALMAAPGAGVERPPNPQARSLLMAAHADTWTLAIDEGPQCDADEWRRRLSTVVADRWDISVLEPAEGSAREADWLDAELYDRCAIRRDRPAPATPARADAPARSGLESKVLRGRNGRLFLATDSYDSHRQIVGEKPLSAGTLDAWERGMTTRIEEMRASGIGLVQLIGPAPQVVHADDLPDGISPSPQRPAMQILQRLKSNAPLYPVDALTGVPRFREPFSKTDSHWNDLGCYVAYEVIMDALGDALPARRVTRGGVSFQDTCYTGDLGSKLHPQRASIFLRARLDRPRARLVEDNRVRNHGRRAVFTCEAAPPGTCIVFGDSWVYPMMLFLAESFRRVVFFHRVNLVDRAPLREERPNVVLMVVTERFCSALPDDPEAQPFERVVRKKTRHNDLVPADVPPDQRHPFLYSLSLDRRLPDRPGFRLP